MRSILSRHWRRGRVRTAPAIACAAFLGVGPGLTVLGLEPNPTAASYVAAGPSGASRAGAASAGAAPREWISYSRQWAVGDLDGDGKSDVVIDEGGILLVAFGNGRGGFEGRVRYEVGDEESRGVALGDVDRDGDLDILVVVDDPERDYASTIYLLSNQGGRRFAEPDPIYAPDDEWVGSFALADVDRDGDLDLVVAASDVWDVEADSIAFVANDGHGRFSVRARQPLEHPAKMFTLADLDSDGDLDLAVVDSPTSEDRLLVLEERGGWNFEARHTSSINLSLNAAIHAADIDGDGDLDLVVPDLRQNDLFALINQGSGTWTSAMLGLEMMSGIWPIALADVDGDGDPDVAAVTVEGMVGIYLNQGDGRFEPPVMPGMGFVMDMEFADLDGDGDQDVIGLDRDAGPADMGGYMVRVGMNQGGGRFGSATALYDS